MHTIWFPLYEVLESVLIEIRMVITYGEGTLTVEEYNELYGVMEVFYVFNWEGVTWVYIFNKTHQHLISVCFIRGKLYFKKIEKKKKKAASKLTVVRDLQDHFTFISFISMPENSIQQPKWTTAKLQLEETQNHRPGLFHLQAPPAGSHCWLMLGWQLTKLVAPTS